MANWLFDSGSLTAKLKALNPDFEVEVLRHANGRIYHDEVALLEKDVPCQVREVILRSAGLPVVFARSVIPNADDASLNALNSIGNQPLGEALFSRSDVTHGPIAVTQFSAQSNMASFNEELLGSRQALWGRRRKFEITDNPVLVTEVFLSSAPCYKEPA
ncbi:chorismate--pyruvate lyase family protein [Aliidiomarina minuta]|uniref:chorismate--pyruvate lyase family protein n=1 Tax=Aliidiomarina minuta TaxID=880057 RepID=UPI00130024E8|nr:chorismate lyase [Aliidiomarina minuta]